MCNILLNIQIIVQSVTICWTNIYNIYVYMLYIDIYIYMYISWLRRSKTKITKNKIILKGK